MNSASSELDRLQDLLLHSHLLDHTYEPIIAWELTGHVIYLNQSAEECYGFAPAEAIGKIFHKLLQTIYPVPLDDILSQLKTQKLWSGELQYSTKAGHKLTAETHLKLVTSAQRAPLVLQCDRDISIYKQSEAAMRQVYEELEHCVAERTYELAAANRELESFSYSVSHDLRAPLRSLEGFARILNLDYAGKVLDDRGLNLMQRMTASVTRMGQLIEDLLKLSQVSRTTIHPQPVDFTAMVHAIIEELSARDPERNTKIQVQPGMTAFGDPGLLRNVLENLLGNAWKFTGRTAVPQITVGVSAANGSAGVYSVQDNGAGFDMNFADQLFAPFQRLHDLSEFEGTGVGLATVQRVIHRHGGRIWAESKPGEGARFFFTLAGQSGVKAETSGG